MGRLEIDGESIWILSPAEYEETYNFGAVLSTNIYDGVETIVDSGTNMNTLCYLKWAEPGTLNNVLKDTYVSVSLYTEGYEQSAYYSARVVPGTTVLSLPPADILRTFNDYFGDPCEKSSDHYTYLEVYMNPTSNYGFSSADLTYIEGKQILLKATCVNTGSTIGQKIKRGVLFAKDPATNT